MNFRKSTSYSALDTKVKVKDNRIEITHGTPGRCRSILYILDDGNARGAAEIVRDLDERYKWSDINSALARLVKAKIIVKIGRGKYRARAGWRDLWNKSAHWLYRVQPRKNLAA